MKYGMQPKAWFNEATMLNWVDYVLKPYVADSVADAIQGLGVELEIIPPGCTGLVQPIDVGMN